MTRPVFVDDEDAKTIGANQARVPEFFYKVVYDETPPCKMIAFILPNEGSKKDVRDFVVSVDDVEEASGLDFFSALPQDVQRELEAKSDLSKWAFRDRRGR